MTYSDARQLAMILVVGMITAVLIGAAVYGVVNRYQLEAAHVGADTRSGAVYRLDRWTGRMVAIDGITSYPVSEGEF